jgi:hypothetical protein
VEPYRKNRNIHRLSYKLVSSTLNLAGGEQFTPVIVLRRRRGRPKEEHKSVKAEHMQKT